MNGYTVRLINVPEVDRPGIESLEYCPYYDNLSEIMLLERQNTRYSSREPRCRVRPLFRKPFQEDAL